MANWHGIMMRSNGGNGDFQEEDVWAILKEKEESSPKMRKHKDYSSGSSSAWPIPAAPKMITRNNHSDQMIQHSSAPLNIPDWSKIYGKNGNMGSRNGSWVSNENGEDVSNTNSFVYSERDYDGIGGDDDDMVPPHEWITRKLARSQISSFSVCEGIGRTLKGRDLSKVRNAILTKTGFIE